jgi:hypothetical protein
MDIQVIIKTTADDVSRILKMSSPPIGAYVSWYPSKDLGDSPKVRTFVIYYPSGFRREFDILNKKHSHIKESLDEVGQHIDTLDVYYNFRAKK